ncbi:MAG: hypothetical protein IV107_24015 [Paucibacter sp.]|nr:hypothetical protein [Roseateles sp.]
MDLLAIATAAGVGGLIGYGIGFMSSSVFVLNTQARRRYRPDDNRPPLTPRPLYAVSYPGALSREQRLALLAALRADAPAGIDVMLVDRGADVFQVSKREA